MLGEDGVELVSYTPQVLEELSFPEPAKQEYEDPKNIQTNDELWHIGEIISKHRDLYRARRYFLEAITRDPGDSQSHISLAELDIKSANYKSALQHLSIAEERDPDNGKLFYLRAVAEEASGDFESAYNHYYRAVHFQEYLSRAYGHIAKLDLRNGNYEKAKEHAQKAIEFNNLNPQLWTIKATALRLDGKFREAKQASDFALKLDPIHPWAMNERRLTLKAQRKSDRDMMEALSRILIDDYHYYIELAMEYIEAGLYESASEVLELAIDRPVNFSALVHYFHGYCLSELGKTEEASQSFEAGMKASTDYIFPFRRNVIDVFEEALRYNPMDARSHYYLGMVYAEIIDGDRAIYHWQKAIDLEPENAKAWRNLGLLTYSYPGVTKDINQAKAYYEKAFRNASTDSRILWELDKIKQLTGESVKSRLSFLKKHKEVVESRDDLLTNMLDLMVQSGEYQEALDYYLSHNFNNWEGRYAIHNSYLEACVGMAKVAQTAAEALKQYKKASEYPENLKVAPREPNLRGFLYYPMAKIQQKLGNENEAIRLLESTASETTEIPTLVNYYRALAFRDLERIENVNQILTDLKLEGERLVNGEAVGGYQSHFKQRTDQLKRALVSCQLSSVGYSRDSFIRASSFVNCQLTLAFLLFLNCCHARTSFLTTSISSILLFRHCPVSTFNSISAMFSQLPCFGVYTNSNLSHKAFALSGGNVS